MMPNFKMASKMVTVYTKFYLFRHRNPYNDIGSKCTNKISV